MRRFHVWCEECGYRAMFRGSYQAKICETGHIATTGHRVIAYEVRDAITRARARLRLA